MSNSVSDAIANLRTETKENNNALVLQLLENAELISNLAVPAAKTDEKVQSAQTSGTKVVAVAALPIMGGALIAMIEALFVVFAILLAIAAAYAAALLTEALLRELYILLQKAITFVQQARGRIKTMRDRYPQGNPCDHHFAAVIEILHKMARKINMSSGIPRRNMVNALVADSQELYSALRVLMSCIDPSDASNIQRVYFGRNGLVYKILDSFTRMRF